jgi:hypothetical protein
LYDSKGYIVWPNQECIYERRINLFHFKNNIRLVILSSVKVVLLLCLGLSACGCATLYVQPATVHGDSLDFIVTVDKPRTPNGLAIIGFPPKTIGINLEREGRLVETLNVNLKNGQYKHTFEHYIKDYEYIVEPRAFVVFDVGLGIGPYKLPASQ